MDLIPISTIANAERAAITAFADWLGTEEGQAAGELEVKVWISDRGWPPKKWREWSERIAAEQALKDPQGSNPQLILAKLNGRFERLAHTAEDRMDLKHAILATEAQAKLSNLGGFAQAKGTTVAIQVNAANAHLVSDQDLERIITQADAIDPLLT